MFSKSRASFGNEPYTVPPLTITHKWGGGYYFAFKATGNTLFITVPQNAKRNCGNNRKVRKEINFEGFHWKYFFISSGLIGRSWAMLFASAGYHVTLYDIHQPSLKVAMTDVKHQLNSLKQTGMLRGSLSVEEQCKLIKGEFERFYFVFFSILFAGRKKKLSFKYYLTYINSNRFVKFRL